MPRTSVLPIMPKEVRTARTSHTVLSIPYPTPGSANSSTARHTSIWSTEDDNRLLQARAAESSWQLVSDKYFPGKTPNACRKRYERLVERRNVEDWDVAKRSLLAQEYLQMRRELWEPLAIKMGVKWTVVEAKVIAGPRRNLSYLANNVFSAWVSASNNCRPQHVLPKGRKLPALIPPTTPKALQIATATLVSVWAPTLRWM